MDWTTCMIVLLYVRAAHHAKAKVRFSQPSYSVLEAPVICVDVINDMPLSKQFVVDFSFSGRLLGVDNAANTRHSAVFFRSMQATAQACITGRIVDNTPCGMDIQGTVTLSNNSDVLITSPGTATIIVMDNDTLSATFGKSLYSISEGDVEEILFPFVNTSLIPSATAWLSQIDGSDYVSGKLHRSLLFDGPDLINPLQSMPLSRVLVDDDVALEDLEYAVLELAVNADPQCRVELAPYNSTTIVVSDDDDVSVQITQSVKRTGKGEACQLCVSTTKVIARDLTINLKITNGAADSLDKEEQSSSTFEIVLKAFDDDMMECVNLPVIWDGILEQDNVFTVAIISSQMIPGSLQSHLHLNTSPSVIIITKDDTSTCIAHTVGSRKDMIGSNSSYQNLIALSFIVVFTIITFFLL